MTGPLERVGVIGAGNIAMELTALLARSFDPPLQDLCFLVRPGRREAAERGFAAFVGRAASTIRVFDDGEDFMAYPKDLAIEAAGHGAVAEYVPRLLAAGTETVIASTGALCDDGLHRTLEQAALAGGTRLVLPAGAVGGMDILAALGKAAIDNVVYTSRKPPRAWVGTHADTVVDLAGLKTEAELFRGTARRAAALFPKNANVAATVALAGCGFDRTQVVLIADPAVSANIHAVEVTSDAATLSMRIEGHPSPANPRTSLPTVYSLAREVTQRRMPIVS